MGQNKNLECVIDGLRQENSKFVNLIKCLKNTGTYNQKQIIEEFNSNYEREKLHEYSTYLNFRTGDDFRLTVSTDKDTNNTVNSINKSMNYSNNLPEIQEVALESQEDDSFTDNLYSPIAINFPEKVYCNKSIEQTKGIIPLLDLSKTNNINYKFEKKEEEDKLQTPKITLKLRNQKNEEWMVSLKYAGLTSEELERISRNKLITKIFEAMLNLNRIIEEKNCLLQNAVQKLKSSQLEKQKKERENIELYQKIITIRKEVENLISNSPEKAKKYKKCTSTNSSSINISNINCSINQSKLKDDDFSLKQLMEEESKKKKNMSIDFETENSMINNPRLEESNLNNTEININTSEIEKEEKEKDEKRNNLSCSTIIIKKKSTKKTLNGNENENDNDSIDSYQSNNTEIR